MLKLNVASAFESYPSTRAQPLSSLSSLLRSFTIFKTAEGKYSIDRDREIGIYYAVRDQAVAQKA